MAVPAVWRLVPPARLLPIGTQKQADTYGRCLPLVEPTDRRDAWAPLQKSNSKPLLAGAFQPLFKW